MNDLMLTEPMSISSLKNSMSSPSSSRLSAATIGR